MLKYPSIGNNTNQHQQKKRQYFMQWDSVHTHTKTDYCNSQQYG